MFDQPEIEMLEDWQTAEIISLGYEIEAESGGCRPDPDDTVRIYAETNRLSLFVKARKQGADAIRKEFAS